MRMALLKRELHRASRGPILNDEDQWHLVFDTDSKRLYIEHRWTHVDVRGPGIAESGTAQLDIADYLSQGGQASWIIPRRTRALPALARPFSRRRLPLSSGEPVRPA